MRRHESDDLDPRQRRARDAVRGLGAPEADPAFRARLKEQFLAGDIPAQEASAPERPPAPVPWLSWAILATAAALAWLVLSLNSLPGPELLEVRGRGTVVVDGRRTDAARPAAVGDLLRPGAHLVIEGEASLDILYPGSLVMRVAPGSDLILPERPGRWFRRAVAADLVTGEISVRTGPQLAGGELDVHTPSGSAVVYGTLINVYHDSTLSCFCLHDGTAHVLVGDVDLGPIPPMMRRVVFADGSPSELADIAPPHLDHMQGLELDRGGVFRGR